MQCLRTGQTLEHVYVGHDAPIAKHTDDVMLHRYADSISVTDKVCALIFLPVIP